MFNRVIIASGPTIEPIDPVRFISNRSSGKSGYHLANEAVKRGIEEIIFITGPTCHTPSGVTLVPVETALEMQAQLKHYQAGTGVIIMAAAVGDYRPAHYSAQKIKKNQQHLALELIKNPDLLQELGQIKPAHQILVGYAAETRDIFEHARDKFKKKNLDLLVLNEISAQNPAFNVKQNQVYLITKESRRKLEKMDKSELAIHIWDEIFQIHAATSER